MENTKVDVGREESQCKDRELKINESDNNNIKYILVTGIKGEKLKKLFFERTKSDTKSPPLAQYKSALIVAAIMLLLWACAVQLTSFQAKPYIASIARKSQPTTTSLISFLIESKLHASCIHFEDIFDVKYFMKSLRDEVRILKDPPTEEKDQLLTNSLYSMPPVSWSNMSDYYATVVPRFKKYKVVHFTKTDARLANNLAFSKGSKAMYDALRFNAPIEELGKKIVTILKGNGPFLALHLRYEMDMLAFSGSTEGCTPQETENLTEMRYLGYKVTINLDKLAVVNLIDEYRNGTLSWDKFSQSMKAAHANRMGGPTKRLKIPGKPKEEDYFYINPPLFVPSSNTTKKHVV
ncbi:hypothetical protein Ddye_030773 [Dipteronia dyeriana]|uniref:O-fucosyltransferase family protein n=1 Tax=Dipteronia dyeriana TaxID=168575 RepID=A0AAD9TH97_9ROSI|nr:hypothetical protein Ddye_030773 [Dipteronia dyeriana]